MLFKKLVVPVKVKQFSGTRRKYISDIGEGVGGGSCDHMLPSFPPSNTTFHWEPSFCFYFIECSFSLKWRNFLVYHTQTLKTGNIQTGKCLNCSLFYQVSIPTLKIKVVTMFHLLKFPPSLENLIYIKTKKATTFPPKVVPTHYVFHQKFGCSPFHPRGKKYFINTFLF
jgi:hypothetical protein